MVEALDGAGTRTIKMRGGMGLLGVMGKYGMYRLTNMLALLDAAVRGVSPEEAKGGRNWSNYTWHGDQAPGFPVRARPAELGLRLQRHAQRQAAHPVGKNLVENKMADAHWFIEMMERGGRIVVITPGVLAGPRPRPTTGSRSAPAAPTRRCSWASPG